MFNATAQGYAAHWATMTSRSAREVYVPEALRSVDVGQRVRIETGTYAGVTGYIDTIGRHGAIVTHDSGGRSVVALDRENEGWTRC